MAKLTKEQELKFLLEKQNTLAIMVEIIKLRHSIEKKPISDKQATEAALKSIKRIGMLLTNN